MTCVLQTLVQAPGEADCQCTCRIALIGIIQRLARRRCATRASWDKTLRFRSFGRSIPAVRVVASECEAHCARRARRSAARMAWKVRRCQHEIRIGLGWQRSQVPEADQQYQAALEYVALCRSSPGVSS